MVVGLNGSLPREAQMKLTRFLMMLLSACFLVTAVVAQDQAQSPPSQYPPQLQQYPPPQQRPSAQNPSPTGSDLPQSAASSHATPPSSVDVRQWVPRGIAAMGQSAATRTEFNIDHSMLALATKLDRDNQDLRRVIAGVNGVAVHSFHFPGGVTLDPVTMSSIAQEYREAGFQHLVSKHRGESGLTTDLWLRMEGSSIRDIAVLWAGARDLNFVSVSGSITPLDLLHLSGHFGIPRMDGGVVVPAPQH